MYLGEKFGRAIFFTIVNSSERTRCNEHSAHSGCLQLMALQKTLVTSEAGTLGTGIKSRTFSILVIHCKNLSNPMPNPACGTDPYLGFKKYHLLSKFYIYLLRSRYQPYCDKSRPAFAISVLSQT